MYTTLAPEYTQDVILPNTVGVISGWVAIIRTAEPSCSVKDEADTFLGIKS